MATRIVTIGVDPSSLDFSKLEIDEATLAARIEAGNAAMRDSGFDSVPCLVDPLPDRAEAQVRDLVAAEGPFGLAMIGGGIRAMPENTLLFERLINVLLEIAPGIRFCFNTSPDTTIDAVRRWVDPQ